MTRRQFIQQHQRQIYGDYIPDDATITELLVNQWLDSAIGVAAKKNYTDNIQIEGIGFINNSFYTTFKGIAVTKDEQFTWKVQLPQLPMGIGRTEGIETLKFKGSNGEVGIPCIFISSNQATFFESMRAIPNKIICKPESNYLLAKSTILLSAYTATVTMVSGGSATDLDSLLNIPSDYFPIMVGYLQQQLMMERNAVVDVQNDGRDAIKTT